MLGPITKGNGECICSESPYGHTEIVAKVGAKGTGSVFNICSNHLPNYQRAGGAYDIELLEAPVTTEAGESHYHNCPICKTEPVECFLPIGHGGCGTAKCSNCQGPKLKPNTNKNVSAGHLLSNTWVCVNGCAQPNNSVLECPKCQCPKPKVIGTCSTCNLPISEYSPEKCWRDHPQSSASTPTEDSNEVEDDSDDDSDEKEEPEECPNCARDITTDNPLKEFNGDDHCSSCYPTCSRCDEELEDDDDKWARCNSCSDYVCKKCRWWCACCEVYLCKGCAHNGDHGVSQEF